MMDALAMVRTDSATDLRVDRQTVGAAVGLQGYTFISEGRGPLDQCRRGLGSVESHRCNWAAKK